MAQKSMSKGTVKKKTQAARKKGFFHSTLGIGVVCAAVSLIMIARGVAVQPQINNNKNKIAELNAQIESEKQNQAEVDEMRGKADTDEYIEKVAREKLGMIKSDEIVFIDVSEK